VRPVTTQESQTRRHDVVDVTGRQITVLVAEFYCGWGTVLRWNSVGKNCSNSTLFTVLQKNRTAADFCCCPTTAFRWKTVLTLGAPAGQKNRIPSENCCFKQQSTAVILLSMVYRMAAESCTALPEWRLMSFSQVWLTLPPHCLRDFECRDLAFISATRMQREHH